MRGRQDKNGYRRRQDVYIKNLQTCKALAAVLMGVLVKEKVNASGDDIF